jgi:hypothetical protein
MLRSWSSSTARAVRTTPRSFAVLPTVSAGGTPVDGDGHDGRRGDQDADRTRDPPALRDDDGSPAPLRRQAALLGHRSDRGITDDQLIGA